jgi:transposase
MDILIPFDSEVRTFDTLYRQIDVRKHLVSGKEKGRLRYDPTKMLALILFCQMEKIHSLRDMAKAARNDIRIMWLTDELKPSHQAIKRFMDDVLSCRIEEIFHELMTLIAKKESINTDILYIDGTKIEANANKYRFVWKKAVEKHKDRLDRKIDTVMARLGERYASERLVFPILETYDSSLLNKVTVFLEREMKAQDVTPVHGKGTRKTALQRDYDEMLSYTAKMAEYELALSVMGPDRNSYAKTDTDATYMRMKDDHMRNGQLKAGYNVQIGVSDEYIMHVDVFQKRTDYMTMIPFLEGYKKTYGVYPAVSGADTLADVPVVTQIA